MAFLLGPAMCAAAGSVVGAITTLVIRPKSNEGQHKEANGRVKQLEEQLTRATDLIKVSIEEKAAAEERYAKFQEDYLVEQMKKEEKLNKEKIEIEKAQAERERLMGERLKQWERKQKEMIEAEKKHQRLLTKEANEGLKRSHDELQRQRALDRERLAKEKEFLSNARLEHERCLEEERERFKQLQASYERARKEDRQRLALEINTLTEVQKKNEIERVTLKKNYDDLQSNLYEAYQKLRRNQRALEELLESKVENLMEEQKNLTNFEKEQKLRDLTETFLDYCELYYNDPVKLTKETEAFQRKFRLQLNKVKNSMKTGDKSLPRLDVWKEGAVLDMKMLSYLYDRGKIKPEAIGAAVQMYRRDMGTLVSNFNASDALPCNVAELRAIENSFQEKLQELESIMDRALPESTSPHLAILAPTAAESSIFSPTRAVCAVAGGGVSAASACSSSRLRDLDQE